MLLSEFNVLKWVRSGDWEALDSMMAGGGASVWGLLFKSGVFIIACSFIIGAVLLMFSKNQSQELSAHKDNLSRKLIAAIAFFALVTLVTIFQTAFVLE